MWSRNELERGKCNRSRGEATSDRTIIPEFPKSYTIFSDNSHNFHLLVSSQFNPKKKIPVLSHISTSFIPRCFIASFYIPVRTDPTHYPYPFQILSLVPFPILSLIFSVQSFVPMISQAPFKFHPRQVNCIASIASRSKIKLRHIPFPTQHWKLFTNLLSITDSEYCGTRLDSRAQSCQTDFSRSYSSILLVF